MASDGKKEKTEGKKRKKNAKTSKTKKNKKPKLTGLLLEIETHYEEARNHLAASSPAPALESYERGHDRLRGEETWKKIAEHHVSLIKLRETRIEGIKGIAAVAEYYMKEAKNAATEEQSTIFREKATATYGKAAKLASELPITKMSDREVMKAEQMQENSQLNAQYVQLGKECQNSSIPASQVAENHKASPLPEKLTPIADDHKKSLRSEGSQNKVDDSKAPALSKPASKQRRKKHKGHPKGKSSGSKFGSFFPFSGTVPKDKIDDIITSLFSLPASSFSSSSSSSFPSSSSALITSKLREKAKPPTVKELEHLIYIFNTMDLGSEELIVETLREYFRHSGNVKNLIHMSNPQNPGATPLTIAKDLGYSQVSEFLLNYEKTSDLKQPTGKHKASLNDKLFNEIIPEFKERKCEKLKPFLQETLLKLQKILGHELPLPPLDEETQEICEDYFCTLNILITEALEYDLEDELLLLLQYAGPHYAYMHKNYLQKSESALNENTYLGAVLNITDRFPEQGRQFLIWFILAGANPLDVDEKGRNAQAVASSLDLHPVIQNIIKKVTQAAQSGRLLDYRRILLQKIQETSSKREQEKQFIAQIAKDLAAVPAVSAPLDADVIASIDSLLTPKSFDIHDRMAAQHSYVFGDDFLPEDDDCISITPFP